MELSSSRQKKRTFILCEHDGIFMYSYINQAWRIYPGRHAKNENEWGRGLVAMMINKEDYSGNVKRLYRGTSLAGKWAGIWPSAVT